MIKCICLNMIVKDEAHIITETLTSIYKFINYLYRSPVQAYHADKLSLFPVKKNVPLSDYFLATKEKLKKTKNIIKNKT